MEQRRAKSVAALALTVTLGLFSGSALAGGPDVAEGRSEDGGVETKWTYSPSTADTSAGVLDVYVSDKRSGNPIRYESGALLGWLQRERPALIENTQSCADKVKILATQGVGKRGDVDLNGYRIVTLNADGSVAFINPFVGFNNAKLESMVDLKSLPIDWVQDKDRMDLWVLLSSPDRLVEIDLQSRSISQTIDLPAGASPSRIALDRTSDTLWIAMPGTDQLGSVALGRAQTTLQTSAAVDIAGLVASNDDGAVAWTDDHNGATLLVGAHGPVRVGLPGRVVTLNHSANAAAALFASADGSILVRPDASDAPATTIVLGHQIEAMKLFAADRYALATGGGRASVIDLSTGQITLEFGVQTGASRIVITRLFAYVVGGPSGRASMIALDDLQRGRAQVLDVIVSNGGEDEQGEPRGAPSRIVAAPEGNGVLVAGALDGMIYQYSEGMMAPVGSYSNYRRSAKGIDIVDYALRQIDGGHYRTIVRAESGGRFNLLLGGVGPRFSSCTQITLASGSLSESETARVYAERVDASAPAGQAKDQAGQAVRVRVLELLPGQVSRGMTGLGDVVLMVFDKRSGWQRRVALKEVAAGEYQGLVKVPRKTAYELLAASSSANLSFVEGRLGEVVLEPRP